MKIIRPVQVTQAGSFTRNTPATYFDSAGVMQTAPSNVMRVTYCQEDLTKPPYAMVEKAATNYLQYSQDFTNPAWAANGATVTNASVMSLDGVSMACALLSTSTDGYIGQTVLSSGVANTDYVFSVWLKVSSGTLNTTISAGASGAIQTSKSVALTTNWKLAFVTFKPTIGGDLKVKVGGSSTIPSGQSVIMCCAQLEQGTVPSSYISTTSTLNTRSADVVSSAGLIYSNIPETDYQVWNATTAYVAGDRVIDVPNHKVYESITGLKNVISMPAGTVFSMVDANNAPIVLAAGTAVKLTTTSALPSPFVAGTTYYVITPTTTTFALSASVGGAAVSAATAGTGVHTLTTQVNTNKPLNDTLNWLLAGYDNRWNMFDQSVTSQSVNAKEIIAVIYPGARYDSVVGVNVAANKATITMTDTTTGKVMYTGTVKTVSNSGVRNWYNYFNEPVVQVPDFIAAGLPIGVSSTCVVTIRLSVTGGNTACGGVIVGLGKEFGVTEWGAKIGINDYSIKSQDTFGNYTITPRAFSKKGDFTVQVPTDSVDFVQNMLAKYRSTPIVYIGSNSGKQQFNSTIVYGFYKDFQLDIAYNAFSVCTLSVEGLT